jgi:hypothetical protein
MVFKGTFTRKYTINRESKELSVIVQLYQRKGLIEPGQNVYYGIATVNGKNIEFKGLDTCVNASYMADKIGKFKIEELKKEAKEKGKTFRLKRKL